MSSSQCLRRMAGSASSVRIAAPSARLWRSCATARLMSTAPCRALPALTQSRKVLAPQTRQFSLSSPRHEDHMVQVPQMAESISEGTLKQFSKQVGDYVEVDEEIATIETDKIDVSVNAPVAGTIKELLAKEEDTVTVGQDLVKIEVGGEGAAKSDDASNSKSSPQDEKTTPKQDKGGKTEKREPADEKDDKIKLDKDPKKGPAPLDEAGSKSESKPEKTEASPPKKDAPPAKAPSGSKQEPKKDEKSSSAESGPYGNREERRVKMNRMRLRIAERLKQSQNTAASLTTFNEVDMSALMEMRKLYKDEILKKTGVKFGFMSAFTRAAVLAMKDIPAVNASIEGPGGGDTIVYRDYVDVSVAVATEKGLVTPVVRNAESLDLIGIESGIAELGKKARDNKLTIEDMAGGTFTISNGGVFGSLMGTPIINLPQTAVLGLHAIKDKPVAINGQVVIRPMMYLALTYDHRLLDGREAVTFLVKIKEYIEDPRRMLLF